MFYFRSLKENCVWVSEWFYLNVHCTESNLNYHCRRRWYFSLLFVAYAKIRVKKKSRRGDNNQHTKREHHAALSIFIVHRQRSWRGERRCRYMRTKWFNGFQQTYQSESSSVLCPPPHTHIHLYPPSFLIYFVPFFYVGCRNQPKQKDAEILSLFPCLPIALFLSFVLLLFSALHADMQYII